MYRDKLVKKACIGQGFVKIMDNFSKHHTHVGICRLNKRGRRRKKEERKKEFKERKKEDDQFLLSTVSGLPL